jgi:DNA-binding response OmpR family regulator
MDGVRTLQAIRKIRPGFPAILFSGYSERIDELTDIWNERTLFIQKPFRSRVLQSKLCSILRVHDESEYDEEVVASRAREGKLPPNTPLRARSGGDSGAYPSS